MAHSTILPLPARAEYRWPLVLVVPLVLLAAGTLAFRITDLDVALSAAFYASDAGDWPLRHAQPWQALYDVGVYPALALGFGGLAMGLASYLWPRWRRWRRAGFFLALLLAVGPGLVVNGILKPYSGRPRPVQTQQFGGSSEFLRVGDIRPQPGYKSFPSGHASMGFFLMAPAFLLYRRRPRIALLFVLLGLAGGCLMGTARVVQGGHYASDILWSAAIVYFCGLACAAGWSTVATCRPGGNIRQVFGSRLALLLVPPLRSFRLGKPQNSNGRAGP